MEIIRAESPPEGSPMADSTAATPGFSGGDRPVGHWGWNIFFQFESAIATFVATLSTIRPATFVATEGSPNLRRDPFVLSSHAFDLELDRRIALP